LRLKLVCPSCHAPDPTQEEDAWRCLRCGMIFDPPMVLCPACGGVNLSENDSCTACGRSLTLVDQVLDRHTGGRTPSFLTSARDQAPALKESEQLSSDARYQGFAEIDRRREETQAAQEVERRKADRALVIFGIALGSIVLAGACLLGLVLSG